MKVSIVQSLYFLSTFCFSRMYALENRAITHSLLSNDLDKSDPTILKGYKGRKYNKLGKGQKTKDRVKKGKGKGSSLCGEISIYPSFEPSRTSTPSLMPLLSSRASKKGKGGKGKSRKGDYMSKGKYALKRKCIDRTYVPSTSSHPSTSFQPSVPSPLQPSASVPLRHVSLQPSAKPSNGAILTSAPSMTALPVISTNPSLTPTSNDPDNVPDLINFAGVVNTDTRTEFARDNTFALESGSSLFEKVRNKCFYMLESK